MHNFRGTDKRGVNVIPHALTNQLVACMRGTLDMHRYIVSTTVQDILDSKPFAEESTESGGEKNDLEREMELIESYNPEIVHALVTFGKNMYLDILKSQVIVADMNDNYQRKLIAPHENKWNMFCCSFFLKNSPNIIFLSKLVTKESQFSS